MKVSFGSNYRNVNKFPVNDIKGIAKAAKRVAAAEGSAGSAIPIAGLTCRWIGLSLKFMIQGGLGCLCKKSKS